MSSPYGLQITENCLICKLREAGFFCDLPKDTLQDLEKIKYASGYPQGAVLFVEQLGEFRPDIPAGFQERDADPEIRTRLF